MYLILFVVALCGFIYYYLTRKYGYWKKKNVPHLKPLPFFGNYYDYLTTKYTWGITEQHICQRFPDAPLVGSYFGPQPALIVQDPEYIKLVTTKDFYYFSGRELSDYCDEEWVAKNLFDSHGDRWRVLRQNLTPLFSSAKMKNMFHLIEGCSKTFETLLEKEISISKKQEVRFLFARFTIDCIGTCAFGVNSMAMSEDQNNIFVQISKEIVSSSSVAMFKILFRSMFPEIFYGIGLKIYPNFVTKFFNKLLLGVFEERKYKDSGKHDFIDLILSFYENKGMVGDRLSSLKSDCKEKIKLDVDENLLIAQCYVFFLAGFETSATTTSFLLYELAKNREVQERARDEIHDWLKKKEGKLVYECVSELPYLEQCMSETLRKYPVLGVITREVEEVYSFPNGVTVERGLRVHLPVYHLHHDPKYYPEPSVFRPERFAAENKHNIQPYTYMPFGEGSRLCIGMRFAKMQVMAGLVTILKNYRVELAEGMPQTIDFEPRSFVIASKQGILLNFIPINK